MIARPPLSRQDEPKYRKVKCSSQALQKLQVRKERRRRTHRPLQSSKINWRQTAPALCTLCRASMAICRRRMCPRGSPCMRRHRRCCTAPRYSSHMAWMRWSPYRLGPPHMWCMRWQRQPSTCPLHTPRTLSPDSSRDRSGQLHKPYTLPTQHPSTFLGGISPHRHHMASMDFDRCRDTPPDSACIPRHPAARSTPHRMTRTVCWRMATPLLCRCRIAPPHTACTTSRPHPSTCPDDILCMACSDHPDPRSQPCS